MHVCSWGYTARQPGPGPLGAYRSPLDDAYHYYALQNQYGAGVGARKFAVSIVIFQ